MGVVLLHYAVMVLVVHYKILWSYLLFRSKTGLLATSIVLVGDYYFTNFLSSHLWFLPLQRLRFPSSPYCAIGKKRKLYVPELSSSNLHQIEESGNASYPRVHLSGHNIMLKKLASNTSNGLQSAKLEVL